MASIRIDCKKFSPNIFNKKKCTSCFHCKDEHSLEALETCLINRKISKCGYLFIAPGCDFSIPLNRTKRWQRRWFTLYDNGELTYSLDEHPDTVPQGIINMNEVLEVTSAEDLTGHKFAIALTFSDHVKFIKGTCKDEYSWWYDVLTIFPRVKGRQKRNATFPGSAMDSAKMLPVLTNDDNVLDRVRHRYHSCQGCSPWNSYLFQNVSSEQNNSIMSIKQNIIPVELYPQKQGIDIHSCSPPTHDKVNKSNKSNNPKFNTDVIPNGNTCLNQPICHNTSINQNNEDEFVLSYDVLNSREQFNNKDLDAGNNCFLTGDKHVSTCISMQQKPLLNNMNQEVSIMKNMELYKDINYSNSINLKKGWLLMLTDKNEWLKYWFVLHGTNLTYYCDQEAEESNIINGIINLLTVVKIEEVDIIRNYGFILLNQNQYKYVFSAMTFGIRMNWMIALQNAANLQPVDHPLTLGEKLEQEINSASKSIINTEEVKSKIESSLLFNEIVESKNVIENFELHENISDDENIHSLLPPSPPLNRTPISKVKERARFRSTSRYKQYLKKNSVCLNKQTEEIDSSPISINNGEGQVKNYDNELCVYSARSVTGQLSNTRKVNSDENNLIHKSLCLELPVKDNGYKQPKVPILDNQIAAFRESFREASDVIQEQDIHIQKLQNRTECILQELQELKDLKVILNQEISSLKEQLSVYKDQCSYFEKQIEELKKCILDQQLDINQKDINLEEMQNIKLRLFEFLQKHNNYLYHPSEEDIVNQLNNLISFYSSEKNKMQKSLDSLNYKIIFDEQSKLKREENISKVLQQSEMKDKHIEQLITHIQYLKFEANNSPDYYLNKIIEENQCVLISINDMQENVEKFFNSCPDNTSRYLCHQPTVNLFTNTLDRITLLQKKILKCHSSDDRNENSFQVLSNIIIEEFISLYSRFQKIILQLRSQLKQKEDMNIDLELEKFRLQQNLKISENDFICQLKLMTCRVTDLAQKLIAAEKQVQHYKQRLAKVESKAKSRSQSLNGQEILFCDIHNKISDFETQLSIMETLVNKCSKMFITPEKYAIRIMDNKKPLKVPKRLRFKSIDTVINSELLQDLLCLNNLSLRMHELNKNFIFNMKMDYENNILPHSCFEEKLWAFQNILKYIKNLLETEESEKMALKIDAFLNLITNLEAPSMYYEIVHDIFSILRQKICQINEKRKCLITEKRFSDKAKLNCFAERLAYILVCCNGIVDLSIMFSSLKDINSCNIHSFLIKLKQLEMKFNNSEDICPSLWYKQDISIQHLAKKLYIAAEFFLSFNSQNKFAISDVSENKKNLLLCEKQLTMKFVDYVQEFIIDLMQNFSYLSENLSWLSLITSTLQESCEKLTLEIHDQLLLADMSWIFKNFPNTLEINDCPTNFIHDDISVLECGFIWENLDEALSELLDYILKIFQKEYEKNYPFISVTEGKSILELPKELKLQIIKLANVITTWALMNARTKLLNIPCTFNMQYSNNVTNKNKNSTPNWSSVFLQDGVSSFEENTSCTLKSDSIDECQFNYLLSKFMRECTLLISEKIPLTVKYVQNSNLISNFTSLESNEMRCSDNQDADIESQKKIFSDILLEQFQDKVKSIQEQYEEKLTLKSSEYENKIHFLENELKCAENEKNKLQLEHQSFSQHLNYFEKLKLQFQEDIAKQQSTLLNIDMSNQQIIAEMEAQYNTQLQELKTEKERALEEETEATIAALNAIRKVHEQQVENEISKFKEKMLHQSGYEQKLQKFSEELKSIRKDLFELNEKYSKKCIETLTLQHQVIYLTAELQKVNSLSDELTEDFMNNINESQNLNKRLSNYIVNHQKDNLKNNLLVWSIINPCRESHQMKESFNFQQYFVLVKQICKQRAIIKHARSKKFEFEAAIKNLGRLPAFLCFNYFKFALNDNFKNKVAAQAKIENLQRKNRWSHNNVKEIVQKLISAKSNMEVLEALEILCKHLNLNPGDKNIAIKNGCLNRLLWMKHNCKDEIIIGRVQEALCRLGFANPVKGEGIKILSIDGGGVRAIVALEILKYIEKQCDAQIYQLFDYICGVSTGALLSIMLGIQRKTVFQCEQLYLELSKRVFSQNKLIGTGNLVWSHSYYDTNQWNKILQEYIGEIPLIETSRDSDCPKFAAVSTVVNTPKPLTYVFRNYEFPACASSQYLGGYNHAMWESVRASSAAPGFFEEVGLNDLLYQDGGLLNNNPTGIAIHEAQLLWPSTPLQCVISIGTGRQDPLLCPWSGSSSLKKMLSNLIESATDTENVHILLSDVLDSNVYFRFNPYLSECITMDEIRSDKMLQLQKDAELYLRKNEIKLKSAIAAIHKTKKIRQRLYETVKIKSALIFNQLYF